MSTLTFALIGLAALSAVWWLCRRSYRIGRETGYFYGDCDGWNRAWDRVFSTRSCPRCEAKEAGGSV